jgi:hypothetical protein
MQHEVVIDLGAKPVSVIAKLVALSRISQKRINALLFFLLLMWRRIENYQKEA